MIGICRVSREGDFYYTENDIMKIALVGVVPPVFVIYGVDVCITVITIDI